MLRDVSFFNLLNFIQIVDLRNDFVVFLTFRNDYRDYAKVCFKYFGNRVKHWITFNEPSAYSREGYAVGNFAPGRCSESLMPSCLGGDSGTEPYLVTHHQLLAHAAAVDLYKKEFKVLLVFMRNFKSSYFIRFLHCYAGSRTLV